MNKKYATDASILICMDNFDMVSVPAEVREMAKRSARIEVRQKGILIAGMIAVGMITVILTGQPSVRVAGFVSVALALVWLARIWMNASKPPELIQGT